MLRIELPEDLPPTFKGVAVRYAYHFNVSARVMEPGVKLGNSEESSSDGRASPTASEAPSTSSRGALSQSLGPASQDLLPRPSSLGSLFFRGPARPNNSTVGRLLTSAESYAWREVNLRVPVHIWPPEVLSWPARTCCSLCLLHVEGGSRRLHVYCHVFEDPLQDNRVCHSLVCA